MTPAVPPPPPGAVPPPPPPPPGAHATPPPPATDGTYAGPCPHCGAPLRPGQDWCLNCGAAVSTEIASSRGWRAPVAIAAAVLLIAGAALVFGFARLSNDADEVAAAPTPTATATAAPGTTPTPAPGASVTPAPGASVTPAPSATVAPGGVVPSVTPAPGASPTPTPQTGTLPALPGDDGGGKGATGGDDIGSWPSGKSAYTVVLFSAGSRSEARSKARGYAAGGTDVGILDSDDYSSLRPGYFVVFSGQYASLKAAQDAADGLQSAQPGAYARQVKP